MILATTAFFGDAHSCETRRGIAQRQLLRPREPRLRRSGPQVLGWENELWRRFVSDVIAARILKCSVHHKVGGCATVTLVPASSIAVVAWFRSKAMQRLCGRALIRPVGQQAH